MAELSRGRSDLVIERIMRDWSAYRGRAVEVDLVGGDAPEPTRLGFVGSIKWREAKPFAAKELRELAPSRAHVPGAAEAKLVVVCRAGIEGGVAVDAGFGPADLLAAW